MTSPVSASFALIAVLAGGCASPGPMRPSDCALSVHPVDPATGARGPRALGPEHVLRIDAVNDAATGEPLWKVTLTDAGAELNRAFSSRQLGKPIALLCGDVVVGTPVVQSPSAREFLFTPTPGAY